MYFKNISKNVSIVLNTFVGKVGIKPGEVIKLTEKIIPPVSQSLKEATEEEYLTFCEAKYGTIQTITEQVDQPTDQPVEDVSEVPKETPVVPEDVPEDSKELIGKMLDEGILEQGEDLVEPTVDIPEEEPSEVPIMDALITQEADTESEKSIIEKQIEALKETWTKAKQAKRKEKITKQIKDLQRQLEKLG